MAKQFWSETLAWATADGTAVANTTTETIIFPNVTIPANYMSDGRALRLTIYGKHSTTGTPTLTFKCRWGGTAGTLLATTDAITTGSGVTNQSWHVDLILQTRSNGSTGTILAQGNALVMTSTSASVENVFSVAGSAAPAAVTVDLTADTALAITATWSAASASNTLTGMTYLLESLN